MPREMRCPSFSQNGFGSDTNAIAVTKYMRTVRPLFCFIVAWHISRHILQAYFTGIRTILQLTQCQWSNPEYSYCTAMRAKKMRVTSLFLCARSRKEREILISHRADSLFTPIQWETALLCNDVSDWLDARLESALYQPHIDVLSLPDMVLLLGLGKCIFCKECGLPSTKCVAQAAISGPT